MKGKTIAGRDRAITGLIEQLAEATVKIAMQVTVRARISGVNFTTRALRR